MFSSGYIGLVCLSYQKGLRRYLCSVRSKESTNGPYLRGGACRTHTLRLWRVFQKVAREAECSQDIRVTLLDPGGVGVEVLDGVERGAEEGPCGAV